MQNSSVGSFDSALWAQLSPAMLDPTAAPAAGWPPGADADGQTAVESSAESSAFEAVSPGVNHAQSAVIRRRQLSHDIHHELGTIMMLSSLLIGASDVGPASQGCARQIVGETRWLEQLQRAYEDATWDLDSKAAPVRREPIRLDLVAADVVTASKLSTMTKVRLVAVATLAHADRLAVWRALRNLLDNAVRAAGATGHVEVRVGSEDCWALAQVEDDGPGFDAAPSGRSSLGLGIVQDVAATSGGQLEIRRGARGGCCVCLRVPLSLPHHPPGSTEHTSASPDL